MTDHVNYYEIVAADLERFAKVPDHVLLEIVTRDGRCMWLVATDDEPVASDSDAELAERICANCTVTDACLELELRRSGSKALGVWGGQSEQDQIEISAARARRLNTGGEPE